MKFHSFLFYRLGGLVKFYYEIHGFILHACTCMVKLCMYMYMDVQYVHVGGAVMWAITLYTREDD